MLPGSRPRRTNKSACRDRAENGYPFCSGDETDRIDCSPFEILAISVVFESEAERKTRKLIRIEAEASGFLITGTW